jgi:hypothetical protein
VIGGNKHLGALMTDEAKVACLKSRHFSDIAMELGRDLAPARKLCSMSGRDLEWGIRQLESLVRFKRVFMKR